MTRAATQEAVRQATADYAASRPLSDALRIGFIRVGEQKAQLSTARDIVQHLHVQRPNEDLPSEMDRYERSIDCAVKAWRSATEVYADIFQSLANVTAAQPSRFQVERRGHTEFADIARTASEAKSAANDFVLYEDIKKADAEAAAAGQKKESGEGDSGDDSSLSESEESGEEEKESVDPTPTNSILLHLLGKGPRPEEPKRHDPQPRVERLSGKIKYDSKGRKILWDRGAEKPNVPYGTLGGSEKKAWKAEKRRQRREKKLAKRAAKMAQDAADRAKAKAPVEDTSKPVFDRDYISFNGPNEPEPVPTSTSTNNVVPQVEYEDVSAEVDARLKAKEEKKAVAKEEKKRKRVSGDSVEAGEVEGKTEKPKRKKAKAEEGSDVVGVGAKKHEREDAERIEGESRKKRKKTKG